MNRFTKFFHELFNPHCEHCLAQEELEREEKKFCPTCEALSMQLSIANQRITSLLNKEVEPQATEEPVKQQIIQTRPTSWPQIRHRLETASKLKLKEKEAEALANVNAAKPDTDEIPDKLTQQLEEKLGISNA